jgi:polyvinyl alcohol dehydrogenase (cytochrome)
MNVKLWLTAALCLAAAAGCSSPQGSPPAQPDPALAGAHPTAIPGGDEGARVFAVRCASCHTEEELYAPSRVALSTRSHEAIVRALTTGSMRPMAEGLSAAEIDAVATYLADDPAAAPVAAAPAAPVGQGFCAASAPPLDLRAPQWNGWGLDEVNSRYQPDPGITAADLSRLQVRWAFAYPEGSIFSQPTVIGDRLFVSAQPGDVRSLDARSGCTYWTYDTGPGVRAAVVVAELPAGAPARFAAFVGDDEAYVHAINAETGELLWKTRIDEHVVGRVTGAPVVHENRLYVPASSVEERVAGSPDYECCTFRGSISALDVVTGEILWKSYAIEEEPRPFQVSSAGTQMYGPSGAAIWMAPSIDVRDRRLYAGTGNPYTEVSEGASDAIIAFDMATGSILWVNQVTEDDFHVMGCYGPRPHPNCPENVGPDWDFGASPILRSLPDGRRILLAGQKSGVIYGMDPDNGGETLWKQRLGAGGPLGGIQWGMAADDRHVYVGVSDATVLGGERRPGIAKLDIATGDVVWHTPAPAPACSWGQRACNNGISAPLTLIPGAVFAPTLDGHLRAYSTEDGSLLWSFDSAARPYATVNGAEATGGTLDATGVTIVNGVLYLNSGYSRFGYPGNVLIALSVDGR